MRVLLQLTMHQFTALTLVISCVGFATAAAADPPSIVLIVADDLGYGDLGCYGAPDVESPVLDQLARDGVRFSAFYSNGPECSPTRTALMTGRYQQRAGGLECAIGTHNVGRYDDAIRLAEAHQLGLPVEQNTLVNGLTDAGYVCGAFGKWHLGYEEYFRPLRHGFDESFGVLGGNADYFRHTESDGWNTLFENDRLIERDGYMTDLITDAALDWYRGVKDRPFFLYVPFTAPHSPIQGPDDDTGVLTPMDEWNSGPREKYAEIVERMDWNIGRILDALAEDGLVHDTLVIFMSDNGADRNGRNLPYRGNKSTTFEGGIRVPCIVRWPGRLPEAQVLPHVTLTMDFTRSMLRVAGADVEDDAFDGIDILANIEQDRPVEARTVFWRGRRGDLTWRAVRHGDLKRIWKDEAGDTESWLFDLADDPDEQHDLLADRPADATHLEELLHAWEARVAPVR